MGGGPSNSNYNAQQQVQTQQMQISAEQQQAQREDKAKADALMQPAIDKNKALATGDRNAALEASMPTISKLSAGFEASKQSIFNSVAPGAARDKALADLEVNRAVTTGGAQAAAVDAAPDKLANIGAGIGSFSLQELGAALSGLQGAGQTSNDIISGKNASKANSMSIFSSLAGVAGSAAGNPKLSDRRLKKNIRPMLDILDRLDADAVAAYQFDYKHGDAEQVGVMAQDLRKVFPELVVSGSDGYLRVDYDGVAAVALAAVSKLRAEVNDLKCQLAARA